LMIFRGLEKWQILLQKDAICGKNVIVGDRAENDSLFKGDFFNTLTKCDYQNYGQSGSVQNHGVLCVLPLNVLHEKIK
jgi:hypothetical protein